MALTVNTVSPQSLQVTFGQVVEIAATIDSSVSLAGQIIRVFPGLYEPNNVVIPYQLATNYFEITYPGAPGTSPMTWVGSKKFQNLTLNLQHVSNTQFILHLDFVVGADRYTVNDNLTPIEVLTPQSLFFSIYEQLRYLNLHVFQGTGISGPNKVVASVAVEGSYVRYPYQEDNFQFNLRRLTTGETVARPIAGEDLLVDFSVENLTGGLNASYDLIIFNTSFCAKNDQMLTLIDNLKLEGAASPTPTALPSLPATNIISMTNLTNIGGDDYAGSFIIDGSRLIRGCEISFIVVVTDIVNRKFSYLFSTVPDEEAVPNPIVDVSGVIDGDSNIYTTSCFGDIAPCQKIQLYSEMDISSYDDEVAALGLNGNYFDNFITINVYALDHLPVANEDLSQYPILEEVGGPPLQPGAAYFIYQVPEDAEGVTFVIFDYVFKDHSIRVGFKLLHPVYTFETIEFYDIDDNLLGRCYDYSNGLKVRLETADINAFDWNRLAIYSAGDEVEIIDGSFTGSSTQINFTVDLDKVLPGDCFCAVGSRAPAESVSTGPCVANTINVQQDNYSLNRFLITLGNTLGPGFAFPRSYLTIKRNGIIVSEIYLDDDWTAPINHFFNSEYLNQNTFTYELFIYTSDGCNYYKMFTLTTNRFVADVDTDTFLIEDECFASS